MLFIIPYFYRYSGIHILSSLNHQSENNDANHTNFFMINVFA